MNYEIEQDCDYAVYSTDGGTTLRSLPTDRSTTADPHGQNFGHGITGSTGAEWVDLTASLADVPAGALVGFRFWTDGAVSEPGFQVDAVSFGDTAVTAWTLDGFPARRAPRPRSSSTPTSRRTASTRATTPRCGPGRTTSVTRRARTGPSACPTRTAC